MQFQWERLDQNTQRVKVLGGWLVKTETTLYNCMTINTSPCASYLNFHIPTLSVVFIPDEFHKWDVR